MSNIRITAIKRKPTDIHGLASALAALTMQIVKETKVLTPETSNRKGGQGRG